MKILTFDELREYRNKFESLNENISLGLEQVSYEKNKNIFLSHSSKDKDDILPGVIQFLEQYRGRVYIDKEDEKLPLNTNRITAEILKRRINKIPKFILIVTENSFKSKWIPWELGLADGIGKYENIALLPIGNYSTDTDWLGQEYLGLYQKIVKGDENDWLVQDYKNNSYVLMEWIND